jgi:hypothetical protein
MICNGNGITGSKFQVHGSRFFSEDSAVKFRFFLNRLSGLSMDSCPWLWVETVNPEP